MRYVGGRIRLSWLSGVASIFESIPRLVMVSVDLDSYADDAP